MPLLSGQCLQMLWWQEGHTGASPPHSFRHFQRDKDSGPQQGGRVQPNFTHRLWEAEGTNRQLAVCIYATGTGFLKPGGTTISFPCGWRKEVFL